MALSLSPDSICESAAHRSSAELVRQRLTTERSKANLSFMRYRLAVAVPRAFHHLAKCLYTRLTRQIHQLFTFSGVLCESSHDSTHRFVKGGVTALLRLCYGFVTGATSILIPFYQHVTGVTALNGGKGVSPCPCVQGLPNCLICAGTVRHVPMASRIELWTVLHQVWHIGVAGLAILLSIIASAHAVLYKRDSRAAIAWVGFVWLVPLVGAFLYLIFGINRLRRQATLLRSELERYRADSMEAECPPDELHRHLPGNTGHLHMLARVVGVNKHPALKNQKQKGD